MIYFIQSQLKIVCDTVRRIEWNNISACEASKELEVLYKKIKIKKHKTF